ncbi:MAG: ComEA family DNA-binding protein [Anaerolineales bacterium]|uniref:ComEA family DNA-binding protein n=1 Tax=Candidatus Desulfolinea nitratireducens TaxID=2841698 RepID=A0A8J6TEL1_9CHLR|nr:ComEA family DNA-binding protein [Candidatus Desulfolinea nitratireducens]MBL6961306.1 ComEA family DNA-binding protein [Anaerolineales bacterium]
MKTTANTILGILIGLLLAGVIWLTARQPSGEAVTLLPPPTPAPISIHITGSVVAPGLYHLPEGSRVADAIQAAGGFLPIADKEKVNLAALLDDGAQLNIENLSFYNTGGSSDRVNINTANLDELDTLPGIGPSTAQAIIDHRRQYGQFQRIDEITNVTGIGPATYDRIKDLITTGF